MLCDNMRSLTQNKTFIKIEGKLTLELIGQLGIFLFSKAALECRHNRSRRPRQNIIDGGYLACSKFSGKKG